MDNPAKRWKCLRELSFVTTFVVVFAGGFLRDDVLEELFEVERGVRRELRSKYIFGSRL